MQVSVELSTRPSKLVTLGGALVLARPIVRRRGQPLA